MATLCSYTISRWRGATRMSPLFIGFFALLLYLRTLAPDVFVSDFAEFQYLPALLGLPHPNGFPLYMLMGWAWAHLPLGNLAWRMNLLSAVWGAITVGLTAGFAQRLSGRARVGWLAAALLALTPTFWGYSLLAERYTLNLALLVAALWAAWEATLSPARRTRLLHVSAFLLGAGLTVHPSDALILPFWFAYLLWSVPDLRRAWRTWATVMLAGATPLVLFLYVPWRWAAYADVPLLPGIGRSEAVYRGLVHVWYAPPLRWDLIRHYIVGLGGYATGLAAGGWRDALERMGDVWPYWRAEIPWPLALLALIGGWRLGRRAPKLTIVLAAFGAYLTLMVAYIQQGKNDAYLLPAFWMVLFAAGFAIDWGMPRSRQPISLLLLSLAFLIPLSLLISRYPDRDLSRRLDIRQWWETALQVPLEKGAALLGHWSDFTPLWYLQYTENLRPDVLALFPPDIEQVIQPWLATGRPLYLAAPTHGWAPDLPQRYTLVPWGRFVRILPHGTRITCFPSQDTLVNHTPLLDVAVLHLPARLSPTSPRTLQFCWRTHAPLPRNVFASLRLIPQNGGGSLDLTDSLVAPWYPFDPIPQGTEGLGMVSLRVPLGTPAGTYRAELSFFLLQPDGTSIPLSDMPPLDLGNVTLLPSTAFRRSLLPRETVPLLPLSVGPLRLRAWYLSRLPVRPGDPVRLEMVWEVMNRPQGELSLQVRFWGRGGRGLLTPAQPLPITAADVGRIVRTIHDLRAPRGLGNHVYLVEPRVLQGNRRLAWHPTWRWIIGWVRVHDRPHLWSQPEGFTPISATWANVAELAGYTLDRHDLRPGGHLRLTLLWRSLNEVDASYKVFVHVTDTTGHIVAQHDSFPAQGTLPTDVWIPGEYIEDVHHIILPKRLPSGIYSLRVGLYDPRSGRRVPVTSSLPVQDRALRLLTLPYGGP